MRTHLILALAMAGLVAPLAFAGCAVPVDPEGVDEPTATTADESNARVGYGFFSIRKNTDCTVRLCTGYFVKEVNKRAPELHVDSLKFLDPDIEELTLAADRAIPDGGIVLRGFIGPPEGVWAKKAFVIAGAFRGMPGVGLEHGDQFYRLKVTERPYGLWAVSLNTAIAERILRVDLTRAVMPHVEYAWLRDRAMRHGAIVAGHLHDRVAALDVSQVFLNLPDEAGACRPLRTECAGPMLPAYTRDADRCLVFDVCIPARTCSLPLPGMVPDLCAEGYTQVGWRADAHGCLDFACEPDFIAAPAQPSGS